MLTISNKVGNLIEAMKLRLMLFIFFYLTLEFARLFLIVGAATHPLMALWGMTLFEVTAIIILNLLYGSTGVGRDINTLSFMEFCCTCSISRFIA